MDTSGLQDLILALSGVLVVLVGGWTAWNAFVIYKDAAKGGGSGKQSKDQLDNLGAGGIAIGCILGGGVVIYFIADLVQGILGSV